jgi:putative membrane protein
MWGTLINVSRNLAVKVHSIVEPEGAEREGFQRELVGFAYALKDHLRTESTLQKVPGWEACRESPHHVPLFLVERLYLRLLGWKRESRLSDQELRLCDVEARVLLDVCGGCERIRKTLIVSSYRAFAVKCLIVYLVTLPWALVHDFQWWTTPMVMLLTYIMIGLEVIAHSVEQPFGFDLDDLDLDGYCRTIALGVSQVLESDAETVPTTVDDSLPRHE